MKTVACVTFVDNSAECIVESNKSPIAEALNDIKIKLLEESNFWFSDWKWIAISINKE